MIINSLALNNYRNYLSEEISFSDGINILYGDNAQGKTNILEAIYMLATTKSHRTSKDKELINFNSDEEFLELSEEQLKDARRLQHNTFKTFNKVDEMSQRYSEDIEASTEIAKSLFTNLWQFGGTAGMILLPIGVYKGKIPLLKPIKKTPHKWCFCLFNYFFLPKKSSNLSSLIW